MSEKKYDMAVIGGGSAGLVAAIGAKNLGARVALIEKNALGGDCLFTGCVPSKTFIRSARFAADVRRAESLGFEIPELKFKNNDFAEITNRVQRVITTVGKHDAPERFTNLGIDVIFGEPRFISPDEIEVETKDGLQSQKISAHRFCIATGSRPAAPPIEGLHEAGYLTNEDVFHLQKMPESLVVLGAGPIGLELGQSFARFGSEVSVIEMLDCVLPREDAEVSAKVAEILQTENVNLYLQSKAVRVSTANNHKIVTVEREGKQQEIHASEILAATGRKPNIEGLNLEAAKVEYDKRCIITNDYLQTTNPKIFAAGDITAHFPFTHMAAYEASVVVRNALMPGFIRQKTDFSVVPWTTFTDPEAARVGMTEKEAKEKFGAENVKVFKVNFADNDRANAEEETSGFTKVITNKKGLILGAHIVGAHAGELIHEFILAMKNKLPVTTIGGMVHVYPTLIQVNQRAGLNALKEKLTPTVKKALGYYFSFWK
jgi:pyruvate/2-oxoglutarate dehydrogenase complex dihydrolipoamide dehydrogenase (E3) component